MRFFRGLIFALPISLALWVLILGIAFAEESSPLVRALNQRTISEINANLQCNTVVFDLQDKLTAAEAKLKQLTDKYEPKPKE